MRVWPGMIDSKKKMWIIFRCQVKFEPKYVAIS